MKLTFTLLATLLPLFLTVLRAAETAPLDYSSYKQSYHVPFGAVGEGYLYEKLHEHTGEFKDAAARQGSVRDWDSFRGWAVVGGVKSETSGMLLDTGLTNMMIQAPTPASKGDVPEGTDVTVHLLSGRFSYSFKVGDTANPTAPSRVSWVVRTTGPLINTGLRALTLYDYLYDADGGYFGLRPVVKPQ